MKENPRFCLEILRDDWLPRLNANFKLADAFQRICHDLLRHRLNDDPALAPVQLVPFTTSGPDGGIDSYGYGDSDYRFIIECKNNESLVRAEETLNDLGKKLKESLEKPGAQHHRFRLWFHPGFKGYYYCVSCFIEEPAKYDGFRQKVMDMIAGLAGIKGLEHLKEVEVTVYAWNDLNGFLEENKYLRHKWLKPHLTVPGCESLSTHIVNPDRPEFKDYLYSEKSPYASRDEFLALNPGFKDFRGENEIYDLVMNSGRFEGCIIHGEGGSGKTRLMLELGLRADKENWLVYKITPALKKLEDLEPRLYPGTRHLLIFDYIEENTAYTADILERLHAIAPLADIKVIANCRNTYRNSPDFPESDDFLEVDLTLKDNEAESRYKDFVIGKITGDLAGLFGAHKEFYELRPVFAVFIRYIYEKYKDRDPDLGIKGIKRFREWLKRRMSLTFKKELDRPLDDERLFQLLALLPAEGPVTGRIIEDFLPYVRPLLDDGWVEQGADPDRLRVIHDSITDEILESWLIQQSSVLRHGMENLFKVALGYDSFKSCFRAVERLADRECFKNRDQVLYTVFTRLLDQSRQNLFQGIEDKFVSSVLLEDETVVRLLAENLLYFREYVESPVFGLPLSFKMNRLSKRSPSPDIKGKAKVLFDTWMKANPGFLANQAISVRIISTFLLFFGKEEEFGPGGEKVDRYVAGCLEKYPYYIKSELVITDWLEARGEKEVVAPFLIKWLEKFPAEKEASFVIGAWLEAGGEKEVVAPFLKTWLEKFPAEMETRFPICAWLNAGGEKEVVAPFLIKWLEKFPAEKEASFVIGAWLEAGGEKEVVAPFIIKWLDKFPAEMETRFPICAWLEAGGEKEVVAPFLIKWLEKFPLEKECTSFVIKSWLENNGQIETLGHFPLQWMGKFPEEMETHFVYKAWLDAGGDTANIDEFLVKWLEKFPAEKEASFVIGAWLEAGGEKEVVAPFLIKWLEKFPAEMETRFPICAWLNAGGEKEVVAPFIITWLEKFPLEMETHFPIVAWLEAGGGKEVVAPFLIKWLEKFPAEKEVSFVIGAWLEAGGEKEVVAPFVKTWLDKFPAEMETRFPICAWLEAGGEKEVVAPFLIKWLEKFPAEKEASFVIGAWLKAGGEKEVVAPFLIKWLDKFPLEMETHFPIVAWLEAGGEKEGVAPFIIKWLDKFPAEKETSFVIKAWLQRHGDIETIRPYLKPWLTRYPLDEENTSFVIKTWLEARGDPAEVAPFVKQWLEHFQERFEATYIITAWTTATGDPQFIEPYALRWLQIYKGYKEADFVIKTFCCYPGLPDPALEDAVYWCRKFAPDPEVLFKLIHLSRYHAANPIFADRWLIEILSGWISRETLLRKEIANIEIILSNISRNPGFCRTPLGRDLLKQWFLSVYSFRLFTLHPRFHFLQRPSYFEVYAGLLLEKEIDPLKHEEDIKKFLAWVTRWQPYQKRKLTRGLEELKTHFPGYQHLWSIVQI